jgi:hypothetical protein
MAVSRFVHTWHGCAGAACVEHCAVLLYVQLPVTDVDWLGGVANTKLLTEWRSLHFG